MLHGIRKLEREMGKKKLELETQCNERYFRNLEFYRTPGRLKGEVQEEMTHFDLVDDRYKK